MSTTAPTRDRDDADADEAAALDPRRVHTWHRTLAGARYTVSTDRALVSFDFVQRALASREMYWCGPLRSRAQFDVLLEHCLFFGVYCFPSPSTPSRTTTETEEQSIRQVGMARVMTDHVTFAYLTDVYLLPEEQGKGLGRWLVACLKERIDAVPLLRRACLLTGRAGRGKDFYAREMGMRDLADIPDAPFLFMLSDGPAGGMQ